jgi:putative transposase
VIDTEDVRGVLKALGRMHGSTSYRWNLEEGCRGRKVWCNDVEREIRSEGHLWASINYVHHNAVKHGYVGRWLEWPWSSAGRYLEGMGEERAREIWERYPVLDMGAGWDD